MLLDSAPTPAHTWPMAGLPDHRDPATWAHLLEQAESTSDPDLREQIMHEIALTSSDCEGRWTCSKSVQERLLIVTFHLELCSVIQITDRP